MKKGRVGYLSALVKLFRCVVLVSSVWTTFGWYNLVRGRFSRCAIGAIRGIAFLCLVRFNATCDVVFFSCCAIGPIRGIAFLCLVRFDAICDVVFFSCCAIGPHDLPLMLYGYCNL